MDRLGLFRLSELPDNADSLLSRGNVYLVCQVLNCPPAFAHPDLLTPVEHMPGFAFRPLPHRSHRTPVLTRKIPLISHRHSMALQKSHDPLSSAVLEEPTAGMAEREGFEPSARVTPSTRFPTVLLRPLGHLSALPRVSYEQPGLRVNLPVEPRRGRVLTQWVCHSGPHPRLAARSPQACSSPVPE